MYLNNYSRSSIVFEKGWETLPYKVELGPAPIIYCKFLELFIAMVQRREQIFVIHYETNPGLLKIFIAKYLTKDHLGKPDVDRRERFLMKSSLSFSIGACIWFFIAPELITSASRSSLTSTFFFCPRIPLSLDQNKIKLNWLNTADTILDYSQG